MSDEAALADYQSRDLRKSDIRWRPEIGFERRCEMCRNRRQISWWPITLEFWDPKNLKVCRACRKEIDSLRNRIRYSKNPEYWRAIAKKRRDAEPNEVQRLKKRTHREWLKQNDPGKYEALLERQRRTSAKSRARQRLAVRAFHERTGEGTPAPDLERDLGIAS